MSVDTTAPLACDPAAITPERRERWVAAVKHLYTSVQQIRELADGYPLRLPTTDRSWRWRPIEISYERRCCPFMAYALEVEPEHGPIWLRMKGGAGVKEFLRISFESANLLQPDVAEAAGLDIANASRVDSEEDALAGRRRYQMRGRPTAAKVNHVTRLLSGAAIGGWCSKRWQPFSSRRARHCSMPRGLRAPSGLPQPNQQPGPSTTSQVPRWLPVRGARRPTGTY